MEKSFFHAAAMAAGMIGMFYLLSQEGSYVALVGGMFAGAFAVQNCFFGVRNLCNLGK